MRQFRRMIFFGSGVHSAFESQALLERVEYGFSTLCGLQQECSDAEFKEAEPNLKDIISDVAMAFGYEIEFVKEIEFNGPGRNMGIPSPTNEYRIQVFENYKWKLVDFKEFGVAIGLSELSYDSGYLTQQEAEDALNFLTHGHTAYLGVPDAPCEKFGKNRFYSIFPRG